MQLKQSDEKLPLIDMAPLFHSNQANESVQVANAIQMACRNFGFFYITGHGISEETLNQLELVSRHFFALSKEEKMEIEMAKGGLAWRGFFPVGDELTSGRPDIKEGIYFGTELLSDHFRVKQGWPLHGSNLWPPQVPELRNAVLQYMSETTQAAHVLMKGIAMSLGLEVDYFDKYYTAEPTILFRIFHYPFVPVEKKDEPQSWGVGEHTDYGLLTLLAQDQHGGLQVKTPSGWIEAPSIPGTLVCNIGDMLDRLTRGYFRSTPHRVLNVSGQDRLSFPLFFDPDFSAEIRPLPEKIRTYIREDQPSHEGRWDGADLQNFKGTYGEYLMSKVSKVFPELSKQSGFHTQQDS